MQNCFPVWFEQNINANGDRDNNDLKFSALFCFNRIAAIGEGKKSIFIISGLSARADNKQGIGSSTTFISNYIKKFHQKHWYGF